MAPTGKSAVPILTSLAAYQVKTSVLYSRLEELAALDGPDRLPRMKELRDAGDDIFLMPLDLSNWANRLAGQTIARLPTVHYQPLLDCAARLKDTAYALPDRPDLHAIKPVLEAALTVVEIVKSAVRRPASPSPSPPGPRSTSRPSLNLSTPRANRITTAAKLVPDS